MDTTPTSDTTPIMATILTILLGLDMELATMMDTGMDITVVTITIITTAMMAPMVTITDPEIMLVLVMVPE